MFSFFTTQIDPPTRFSADLSELIRQGKERPLTVRDAQALLQGRGFMFCLFLLSIPFLFPFFIPGLSTIIGVTVTLMGCRLALRFRPPLPDGALKREIKRETADRALRPMMKFVTRLEKLIKPRLHFVYRWKWTPMVVGIAIAVGGAELMYDLPFYLPFAKLFPGVSIALLALGMMERDGLAIVAGFVLTLVSWSYIIPMYVGLGGAVQQFLVYALHR
jgi:hypothetical protein